MPSAHIRNNRIAKGLCAICGVNVPEEGKVTCRKCLDKKNKYRKEEYQKYKAKKNPINLRERVINKGLCLNCLEPISNKYEGKIYCDICQSKQREKTIGIKVWDNENQKEIYIKELLIGQKFGMLTVLDYSHCSGKSVHYWVCQCDCGTITLKSNQYLKNKGLIVKKHCGCQDGK